MKIAIISDIHDNLANFRKSLVWCRENKIKKIICCGDVTSNETLGSLAHFAGEIYLVSGNADFYDEAELKKYKNIIHCGRVGRVQLGDLTIGICHEPWLIEKVKEKGECDFIFYGHTHKPWQEERADTQIINPGTLSGMFLKSTFACLDLATNNLELIIVDNL